jgi:hypothetical protein
LIAENKNDFFKNYQNVLMIPRYHDLNNENSYHMMMLGMCLCLSDNYKVIYNREECKGRCDLIIQAHDEKKTSFIIEFKYFKEDKKDFEKALDKLSNEAIQQIKDRRYDYDLKGKVIYIGLAHHGKDVMMKWEEKVYI